MGNKHRELTKEERNGNFHFTSDELKGKTVIQEVAERCFDGVLSDLEKNGIVICKQ